MRQTSSRTIETEAGRFESMTTGEGKRPRDPNQLAWTVTVSADQIPAPEPELQELESDPEEDRK